MVKSNLTIFIKFLLQKNPQNLINLRFIPFISHVLIKSFEKMM